MLHIMVTKSVKLSLFGKKIMESQFQVNVWVPDILFTSSESVNM